MSLTLLLKTGPIDYNESTCEFTQEVTLSVDESNLEMTLNDPNAFSALIEHLHGIELDPMKVVQMEPSYRRAIFMGCIAFWIRNKPNPVHVTGQPTRILLELDSMVCLDDTQVRFDNHLFDGKEFRPLITGEIKTDVGKSTSISSYFNKGEICELTDLAALAMLKKYRKEKKVPVEPVTPVNDQLALIAPYLVAGMVIGCLLTIIVLVACGVFK